ncbi:Methyltransferase domain-containing protein [Neorhodopirellula lusitana]|uniref:Arsenite methyltransferase n=1 Tax=Neorhodopirellula lusitana TaxID=445327 RepID=A0ABY1PWQ5_9BACT|nr:methyltransferase domain-containing protein [Neorhodopirellula lusitana]SMP50386.1 Methyltransferase domain-containing protein [Neorhodopirellula lusitana]
MNDSTTKKRQPAEASVHERYAAAAEAVEPALCCPVQYSAELLNIIPQEIIDKDYGCGDPTPFVQSGDTVLDLGSGGGKLCFIAAQVVGEQGRVIGVDCNHTMLNLARQHAPTVAERVGYANVDFRYGLIQDLKLDLDELAVELAKQPISDPTSYLALRNIEEHLRDQSPMIPDDSVDCVLSNCVLNLVRGQDRRQLFAEIFRVLRKGGRAAISDIVSDETVPDRLQQDPELWSGCITGAFREDEFMKAFEEAGFHGIELVKREVRPWRTVEGIEFRSVTVVAHKGKQGPCLERNQAVVYRGPFKQVVDDDGHTYRRGERIAVCDKTFQLLQQEPYVGLFDAIEPRVDIPIEEASTFHCRRSIQRDPRETKGRDYHETSADCGDCGTDEDCC